MKTSTTDDAEGKMHQVKGMVKEVVGKAVGNRDLEGEGRGENLDGKIQENHGWKVSGRKPANDSHGVESLSNLMTAGYFLQKRENTPDK